MFDLSKIRNFCIVAHIDHGKSTLADRLIESTDTVSKREMENRLLDNMDIERERGITIKLQTCRMFCHFRGEEYLLNLIDTPGHVDFTYEVSRSLAACEGALLVVDATQGVEAQTLTNAYLALDNGLEILPVINKIDLQSADPDGCAKEIEDVLGLPAENAPRISAKEGTGIDALIERIITDLPAPSGDPDKPFRALIFDSFYDNYRGAISMVRVGDGVVRAGDVVTMMSTGKSFEVTEVGVFTPRAVPADCLYAGTVGYIAASVKNVSDTAVGDTITLKDNPTPDRYGGYKRLTSMVYAGIYAADRSKYGELKEALEKLRLNDASLSFEPEVSAALGFGCRCGFLGLLHMEIIEERLEREFDLEIVTTAPSVSYRITLTDGSVQTVSNPALYPQPERIDFSEEPYVRAEILTPPEYVGSLMELCKEKRGIYKNLSYLDAGRSSLVYEMPLNEIIYDFFDALKSRTRGYASLDYEFAEYRKSDLVRLDMLLNGEPCDALSVIVPRDRAYAKGRAIAERLKDVIPRRQFEIPIQAAVGGKVIARETVKAVRKDVLAKCYGGDITRKKKLLEKQKEGKKRMRKLGSVEVPAEAFASILKTED